MSDKPSIVPFLKTDDAGPFLEGTVCNACGHRYVGARMACAQCTSRTDLQPVRLAETGKLYDYTIVHRSFPGVKTPFVDAIVDLDDGAHIKGTLLDIDPDPAAIAFDMPVKLGYREEIPVGQDKPYLTYFFTPA